MTEKDITKARADAIELINYLRKTNAPAVNDLLFLIKGYKEGYEAALKIIGKPA